MERLLFPCYERFLWVLVLRVTRNFEEQIPSVQRSKVSTDLPQLVILVGGSVENTGYQP